MDSVAATEQDPELTREEFMTELRELVIQDAPKVFALCEEIGECDDGFVRYWGLAFGDHAELVSTCGGMRGSFRSAESAHHRFSRNRTLHLVWT